MKFSMKMLNIKSEFERLRTRTRELVEFNDLKTVTTMKYELAAATPVDTGEARDGWRVEKTLLGHDVKNDVPHIVQLNDGYSKQAPPYFVEGVALKYGTPLGAIVDVQ